MRSPSGQAIFTGSPGGGGMTSDGSLLDRLEPLFGRQDHAADTIAKGGAHDGCWARVGTDRDCPSNTVDRVVATGCRADRLRQERQLLGEDLLERPVTREQAVAHDERLLPVTDHLALRGPVVVSLDLLGRACAGPNVRDASMIARRRIMAPDDSDWLDSLPDLP